MGLLLLISAVFNVLGGIALLLTLQKLKENQPPF